MSKIEVDAIEPQSGTALTIGASGDTITIPSGATLANSGTATGFASIAWQSSIVTAATLNADAGKGYWIDTSSNACTVTFPGSASVGDRIILVDYARNWATNAVTINQNGLKFQGNTSPNPVYDTNGQSVDIVFSGTTKGWIPNSDDDVTFETPQTYSSDILVVAGGGSQGNAVSDPKYASGGGGAGGFRTSTSNLTPGATYTVTVGAGGVQNTDGWGTNGSNSSISGTGVSITSTGGGCGGDGVNTGQAATVQAGQDGGSGGGGGAIKQTAGSGNTPSTSPSQGNNGGTGSNDGLTAGGGGGGAGATGANGDGDVAGGNGGNGTASSITGSSVTYAGGGGGGAGINNNNGTAGSGGSGGGGNGSGSVTGSNGTVNTGGGGGGSRGDAGGVGASGGSGIVIIRVLTSDYSGTTTGSPTVTTDGSHKVIQFTGSGSYTA